MGRIIKLNDEEYEEIPSEAVAASQIIADYHIKLGRPETPLTESGKKLMNIIIAIWEDLYPRQAREWYAMRKEYQDNEMSTREQVRKQTGRSLASYPMPIYKMMKAVFRGFDSTERKNCMKMVAEWPMFRMANKA